MNATRQIDLACRVLGLPLLITSSAAAIQIDSFDAPSPQTVVAMAADGTVTIDGPRSGAGILGVRTVTKNGNAFEAGDSISVGDGALTVVSQPFFAEDSTFTTQVIYDFTGEPGFSVSFAGETGLELTFAYINSYGFLGRTFLDSFVDIYTTGGDLQALPVPYDDLPGGTRTDFVPFSLFTGNGDLSHVTGLRIWFNDPLTTPRIDYTLTNLRTVPEPSTFVMLAVLGVMAALVSTRVDRCAARAWRPCAFWNSCLRPPRACGIVAGCVVLPRPRLLT